MIRKFIKNIFVTIVMLAIFLPIYLLYKVIFKMLGEPYHIFYLFVLIPVLLTLSDKISEEK